MRVLGFAVCGGLMAEEMDEGSMLRAVHAKSR
jgi:hypothetical protein